MTGQNVDGLNDSTPSRVANTVQKETGYGTVGRAVASKTRDPWFESSHRQILFTSTVLNTVLKRRK